MNNRFSQFLAAENISQSQFAERLGVTRASVSHIVSGRNKPGNDFILSLMNAYPDLNIEWILAGKGKMYKTKSIEGEPQQHITTAESGNEASADSNQTEIRSDEAEHLFSNLSLLSDQEKDTVEEPPVSGKHDGQDDSPSTDDSPAMQSIEKKRVIEKIIVFYSDGTFLEIR